MTHLLTRGIVPAVALQALLLTTVLAQCAFGVARPGFVNESSFNVPGTQDSNIYTIKDAGLQFEIPKGWKSEVDKNVVLSIEDGAATITFVVEDEYKLVIAGMKEKLKEELADMKSTSASKEDIHNGMTHISESGTGTIKGVPITWSIDVIKASKPVTVLTFGIQSILESHTEEYLKFVASIKKI
ncbi:MAG: hypothetical protein QOH96_2252 [Blastocatellia bacterium]|jgi:hypothetical protein|nr:hypothetical protein [Blastocatellia bacterium]